MSKIILITHQKGGVGKSTITANLAFNLSSNASVGIVDLDQQGSLASLSKHFSNIKVYAADTNLQEIKNFTHDIILIDTPPYLFKNIKDLAKMSDLVIVPTRAGILDTIAINQTLEILLEVITKEKILVVLNLIKSRTSITDDVYREIRKSQVPIAKTRISDLVDFTRSIVNNGLTQTKSQYQIDALTKEVLTKLISL